MTLPPRIDPATKSDELAAARAFLVDHLAREPMRMPLAVLLAEAIDEIVRLRRRLGERFGAAAGYKRVTLCGSARFLRAYREWALRLTVEEHACVQSAMLIRHLGAVEKDAVDLAWFASIEDSDEVFVIDVGGYIGDSTREEIAFAVERGIKVRLLSAEHPGWTEAQCRFAPAEAASPEGERAAATKTAASPEG